MEEIHDCQWNSFTGVQISFLLLSRIVFVVSFTENKEFPPVMPISHTDNKSRSLLQTYEYLSATRTTDIYNDVYSDYEFDYDNFKIRSDHCETKSNCTKSYTFPDKTCHCDKLCGLFNDCCRNYGYTSTLHLTKDQFECVPLHEIVVNRDYGVTIVTKCSPEWDHNKTRTFCEDRTKTNNTLLSLPVSDKTEFHVMYRNMYCAQCNFVNDFFYWKQEILCPNETGVRGLLETKEDCILFFIRPQPEISYRTCEVSQSIISTCNMSEEKTYELKHNCTDGVYAITYDESGKMYRNKYCALCNGVPSDSMFCEQFNVTTSTPKTTVDQRRFPNSLRLLVDTNTGTVSYNDEREKMIKCKENEIYDGVSRKCRKIYCAPSLTAINGVCKMAVSKLTSATLDIGYSPITPRENCTFTKLAPSEYKVRNNSITNSIELFIISHHKVYSEDQFHWSGSDVIICVDEIQNCTEESTRNDFVFYSDAVESYLTLIGLVVSIVSLILTLVVYISFPQLLNIPGKILVSLIVSILLAQILFLSSSNVEHLQQLCATVSVLVHYFFLAAFCWMNVIAFDLWMTFSNRFMNPGSDSKGGKRFIMYSLYAWLLPVLIVCTAVILDFVDFDIQFSSLKPGYGNGKCWISSRNSLILFFAGPLAVFKIFDIFSFISTAIHIARAKKQAAMATRKRRTCSFIVNVKLSLIMGLTWVFAFVANAIKENAIWYLFIIFNSLQGLFIAVCFLFTKKVGRLISDKYRQVTTKRTSGTQISSLA